MCVGWGLAAGQEFACQKHANGTSRSAAQKSSHYFRRAQGVVVIITVNLNVQWGKKTRAEGHPSAAARLRGLQFVNSIKVTDVLTLAQPFCSSSLLF